MLSSVYKNWKLVMAAIDKADGVIPLAKYLAGVPETIMGWVKYAERTDNIERPALDKMQELVNGSNGGRAVEGLPDTARPVCFDSIVDKGDNHVAFGVGTVLGDDYENAFIPNAKLKQLASMGVKIGQNFMAEVGPGDPGKFPLSVVKIYRGV